MIGDAVPIRHSHRVKRKVNLLSIKKFPKKKIRKSPIKKRTSNINHSLLTANEELNAGGKNKLVKSTKQTSKFLKQASRNLKFSVSNSPRITIPKICSQKMKTRNSLNTSHVNLKNNKVCLKKGELTDNAIKVKEKKNPLKKEKEERKFDNSTKKSVRKSLRLSKSSLPPKEKVRNEELNNSDLKTSKEKRASQKKSTEHLTALSSKLVLTPNPEKSKYTSKYSGRKKAARFSIEQKDQEISMHTPATKSLAATPVPGKVTRSARHSRNEESGRSSKGTGKLKKANADISLYTSSFHFPLETPQPEKHVEKRRSSRSSGNLQGTEHLTALSSKLVLTPNPEKSKYTSKYSGRKKTARFSMEQKDQEISMHTLATKSLAAIPVPGKVTRSARHSGNREFGRSSGGTGKLKNANADISLHTSLHSLLETPQPEKHVEKRKSSRSLESSALRTLNKDLSLSTPASLLTRNRDSTHDKSPKSCKSIDILSSGSRSRKKSKPKVSNIDGCTASHEKQKGKVRQHQKTSENFPKPLSNEAENVPIDVLTTPAFALPFGRSTSKKYLSKSDSKVSKRKLIASPPKGQVASEELQDAKKRKKSADFPKMPTKGTLKHKRWLLNHLEQNNGSYEDDIFENKNFDIYKSAFHFGDESDGSSVNIATPKFDCILTPALPKKTPRFKDCISPMEFLQARKTAEEYLYRRNKKRRSGNRPSSGKKTGVNRKDAVDNIPEKKKLDFAEAIHKLAEVRNNLEIEAEVDDEEKDSYFSDASN